MGSILSGNVTQAAMCPHLFIMRGKIIGAAGAGWQCCCSYRAVSFFHRSRKQFDLNYKKTSKSVSFFCFILFCFYSVGETRKKHHAHLQQHKTEDRSEDLSYPPADMEFTQGGRTCLSCLKVNGGEVTMLSSFVSSPVFPSDCFPHWVIY